jgi:hypothetical protein
MPLASPRNAVEILDQHYLEVRCKLLEVAATLDRIERADDDGRVKRDPRLDLFRQALDILASDGFDRAERIQLLFSDQYDPEWNR